jgi:hypothetical protein
LSARSDEAELVVGTGVAVDIDIGAAIEVAAVGLAIGVSVATCANKLAASAIEQMQRRNDIFMGV